MFGFLKKKIGEFVDKIAGKPEDEVNKPVDDVVETKEEPIAAKEVVEVAKEPVLPKVEKIEPAVVKETNTIVENPKPQVVKVERPVEVPKVETQKEAKPVITKIEQKEKPVPKPQPKPVVVEVKNEPKLVPQVISAPKVREVTPKPVVEPLKTRDLNEVTQKDEKKFETKQGLFSKITNVFKSEVELKKEEVEPALDDLQMSLLEADVSYDTAEHIVSHLKNDLIGRKIAPNQVSNYVNDSIKNAILEILNESKPKTPLLQIIQNSNKPFVVMFIGPNGAGKTTTIAKLSKLLTSQGLSCVISASDTFRAAAIQQSQHHGEKLGVKVIAHKYGADPAAVAFDAINHAKAHKVDVVLMDTAGRQDTNVNLLQEMEKVNRVIKPDLKIFIGESLAGHALIEQVKTFTDKVKIDGLILTKLDCDPKGGNTISIAHETKTPIYYLGLGQEYQDLAAYEPEKLIQKILAE